MDKKENPENEYIRFLEKTENDIEHHDDKAEKINAPAKRVPIRKRLLSSFLLVVLFSVLAVAFTSFVVIYYIKSGVEDSMSSQIIRNMRNQVRDKADSADIKLNHYENYIIFLTDYLAEMYEGREELLVLGSEIEPPSPNARPGEFCLQSSYAKESLYNDPDVVDDMYFFSNMGRVYAPIVEENSDLIVTAYTVSKNGFMLSYDDEPNVAANPDGSIVVYDFFKADWYKQGIESDGIFYTGIYPDAYGRGLVVTVGSPFTDEKGNVKGVTCIDYNITELYNLIISMDLGKNGSSFAIDSEGNIITPDSLGLDIEEYTGLSNEEAYSLLEGTEGILETEDAFYVYAPIDKIGWTLCACVQKEEILESVNSIDRTVTLILVLFMCVTVLIIVFVIFIANSLSASITEPMYLLTEDMEIISRGNLDHRIRHVSEDEVGDLADRLNMMVDKLKLTITKLDDTQKKVDAMSDVANKDSLTGIRNKMAFDRYMLSLDDDYRHGMKEFGFAIVDLNGLGKLNDEYGHDKGNAAIKKLCYMVCHVFEHSPVFRTGGDEFTIVLKGVDYKNIDALILEYHGELVSVSDDDSLEPWEKFTAAIGFALYDEFGDRFIEDVMSRAETEMYECKKRMKT